MSAKKNIVISIAALIISACSLFNATTVKATTSWDNVIQPTQNLIIGETDRTSTYLNYMRDNCDSFYYNSLLSTMSDPAGKIAVVQQPIPDTTNVVTIQWTTSTTATTTFLSDTPFPGNYAMGVSSASHYVNLYDTPGLYKCYPGNGSSALLGVAEQEWYKLYLSTYPVVYPTGYAGSTIPNPIGSDNDGLNAMQEQVQGTSDNSDDSDGDGLNDFIESQWNPNRDNVFCGTQCAYPNPAQKDLYVEIDWVNDGSREYKPTSSQLETVVDTFENQDIVAHFDSGQYGGGNQLPALTEALVFESTEDELDFYDLKNGTSSTDRQFAENRKDIWRYMITGQNFIREYDGATPKPGTTGSAYAGNDDSIISIEKIETEFPVDILHPSPAARNAAISGTILHELGHNLCLSDTPYPGQSLSCLYQGIDNNSGQPPTNDPDEYYDLEDYESVMNYRYQFNRADYSHGPNGSFHDHDDWSAITIGMNDFVGKADPSESTFFRGFIQQPED